MPGAEGRWRRERQCFMGTEFQLRKMKKVPEMDGGVAAQQCE